MISNVIIVITSWDGKNKNDGKIFIIFFRDHILKDLLLLPIQKKETFFFEKRSIFNNIKIKI